MELALARLIPRLRERGIRHAVAALRGPADIRDRFDASVGVCCMAAPPNDPRLPLRLARLIGRLRPSVIHARNWGAWPDIALARLLVPPRVPLVFSFHGLTTTSRMPFRRRLACRMLAAMTTHLFTVSRPSRRILVEDLHLPRRRIGIIYNGVDTELFSPPRRRRRRGRFVVGTVGSLKPVKNQSLLVRACADLAAAGTDVELRIAGDGPDRQMLADLAASTALAGRLKLAGRLDDVPAFLRRLDVFALPSDSEGHPNALMEAMACGLPCVATRVGAVGDVLDAGRAGVLVDPGDQAALAAALAALAADPARRADLGREARRRACERYSLEQMADAYASMYERLAARSRRGWNG
jgi:glycosyltransferase involved in cell wall biosynthesis